MSFKPLFAAMTLLTALVTAGFSTTVAAQTDDLTIQDSFVKTVIDQSVISGSVMKDDNGYIKVTDDGYVLFKYTGTVYSVGTVRETAELKEMEDPIGTIEGIAKFPMDFAMGAIAMKAYMLGAGPAPEFPATIDWTCASCTMTVGDNVYQSIVDQPSGFDPMSVENMRLKGRAFTGFGPVEAGRISDYSMSVRLAGCSAVVGVDGPDSDKIGTLCMNSTLTFDLAGVIIDPNNPMASFASTITGDGTSNCTTVLQPKMQ